jgi:cation transport ATPase
VAIFDDRFFYFCDRPCRELFVRGQSAAGAPDGGARIAVDTTRAVLGGPAMVGAFPDAPAPMAVARAAVRLAESSDDGPPASPILLAAHTDEDAVAEPGPLSGLRRGPVAKDGRAGELGGTLTVLALSAGVLGVSLALAGSTPVVAVLRVALAAVGQAALIVRAVRGQRDPADVHPIPLLAGGVFAVAIAVTGLATHHPAHEEAAAFAGLVVTATAFALHVVERGRQSVKVERARIAAALSATARRVGPGREEGLPALDVKAGEELLVEAGDVVPADAMVVSGEASVLPWLGATESVRRREGDAIVAGAKLVTGKVRLRATYTGADRAWARLALDPRRRADVFGRGSRLARHIAERGGAVSLLLAGLAALANGETLLHAALVAVAAYAAVTTAAVGSTVAIHVARGVLQALRRGIVYRSAGDWDRAGEVSIAAFCARNTLLLGEPELADLEAAGKVDEQEVLALAAGAESTSSHPVAMAIQRAAAARRVRPDAVRSPNVQVGLGVTAVASTGEALCVGSRALMLREKISVAIAEQTIAEIEAHGREVLLVALAGKLVGVIGLQDGFRPGARAAVQHLLDAQVEPVLISGDSRETCEAIGRALDIEHLRPEVLSGDRALEVQRLREGGMTVAVLGHPRTDEAALTAADVAVSLAAAGTAPGEWAIALASDDVRDGALAISLARRVRSEARVALLLALAPGIGMALAVAFGLVAPACAPLAALAGAIASALHARSSDSPARPGLRMTGTPVVS